MRTKLLLTLLAIAVPLVALMTWWRGELDYHREIETMQDFIVARMVDGRHACETDPESFPASHRARMGRRRARDAGPRRPILDPASTPPLRVFAYGSDYISLNKDAPTFPEALRQSMEAGALSADSTFTRGDEAGLFAAQRMPWEEGPCVIVLAIRNGYRPGRLSENQIITAVALALGMAFTAFLAAGPIVNRVRLLTKEVRVATSGQYTSRVTVSGNDEISVLAEAFNTACSEIEHRMQELEARDRDLRKFIANTMHDVMTPMTVLQGHVAELKQGTQTERTGAILKAATEESQYISSLLRNLAVSAKLQNPALRLEPAPVDLCALLERVAGRHQVIVNERSIELNLGLPSGPVYANADITMIEQAVSNLVHNAVSYVPTQGHAAITLLTEADGGWALSVEDDGPGIEPAKIDALLKRSHRGNDARTRRPEGQGLGLHIASEVVHLHGFELELCPSSHGGLKATIRGQSEPS